MSISEIEAIITKLPPSQVTQIREWIDEYDDDLWDKQIENDLKAGKLDELLSEVDAEIESGLGKPL